MGKIRPPAIGRGRRTGLNISHNPRMIPIAIDRQLWTLFVFISLVVAGALALLPAWIVLELTMKEYIRLWPSIILASTAVSVTTVQGGFMLFTGARKKVRENDQRAIDAWLKEDKDKIPSDVTPLRLPPIGSDRDEAEAK